MAKVSLRNLSKSYGGKLAIGDLNLEIADREFVVLLGPSGAGKSSILRMIAGLDKVSRGEIFVGDRAANETAPKDRGVALVVGRQPLYPAMSIRENVVSGLKQHSFKASEITRRLDDAASILGLGDLLAQRPSALSPAQRQRVAIARALVRQPKVLLFDEPLAGLDEAAARDLRTEIARLHQRGTATVIYGTTRSADAMMLADRIVLLQGGCVQQADTPAAIYAQPANLAAASALGTPAMNLIHGSLKQEREGLRFIETGDGSIDLKLPIPSGSPIAEFAGKPIVLGVRPEEIALVVTPKGQRNPEPNFPAVTEIVEPFGAETILHLQTGAHALFCRTRAEISREEAGRRMRFVIDPAKLHWFDPASTLRIAQP